MMTEGVAGNISTGQQRLSFDLLWHGVLIIICLLGQTFAGQTILSEQSLVLNFCSQELWAGILNLLGARAVSLDASQTVIEVPFFPICLLPVVLFCVIAFLSGLIEQRNARKNGDSCSTLFYYIHMAALSLLPWGMIPGVWFILLLGGLIIDSATITQIMYAVPQYVLAISLGGMMHVLVSKIFSGAIRENKANLSLDEVGIPWQLGLMILVYTLIYTTMNWCLYYNLRMPHGDSAMYEEHLYNLLHGKGFRSYLDQGLFLGEHIQIIHALLLPLYYWWQSILLLEFLQSLCLAFSAIPVYRMAKRVCGSKTASLLLAGAVLLYYPLQFLDISIDLKTFRPTAFCIPALLFALDAMEQQQYRTMSLWFVITLTGQEDLTLIIGPIAMWLLLTRVVAILREDKQNCIIKTLQDRGAKYGLAWMVMAPVYLWLAMKLIHWFRGGVEIHYAGYFQKFGQSMSEVMQTMLLNPVLVIHELAVTTTLTYFLGLLLPLGFLSLRSPGRLLTGMILFITLCLNELNEGRVRAPHYHFHAPIIPIIFWSAAMGLTPGNQAGGYFRWGNLFDQLSLLFYSRGEINPLNRGKIAGSLAVSCGLVSGFCYTLSPLGIPFWDHGSHWYYAKLYLQDERAKAFELLPEIPRQSRVASTDFVHPRFTQYERSYDYSNYKRKQSNFTENVPVDTDYIVIDTKHPYSSIKRVEEMREWQNDRNKWELLEDQTHGYYIVLKRKPER